MQRFRLERYLPIAVALNLYLPGIIAEVADFNRCTDRNRPVSDWVALTCHRGIGWIGCNRHVCRRLDLCTLLQRGGVKSEISEQRQKNYDCGRGSQPYARPLSRGSCEGKQPSLDLLYQDPKLANEGLGVVFLPRRGFGRLRRCGRLVD